MTTQNNTPSDTQGHYPNAMNTRADELARSAVPRKILPLGDSKAIHLYTAVSYSVRSTRGSWAVILRYREKRKVLAGTVVETTANCMHIHGALAGLAAIRQALPVHIYTFSGYLRDGLSRWVDLWERSDWTTREGLPVRHDDLWQQLQSFKKRLAIDCYLAEKAQPPCEIQEAKCIAQDVLADANDA